MKIYINNFNLNNISNIQKTLFDLLCDTQTYIELYTDNSIYQVDSKNIYSLEPIDREINIYKNYYNDITLIVDNSFFNKQTVSAVNGNQHLHKKITKLKYKLNKQSKISFIIETNELLNSNKQEPYNVYFESDEDIDIKELFNKQEIIEFLSLLN